MVMGCRLCSGLAPEVHPFDLGLTSPGYWTRQLATVRETSTNFLSCNVTINPESGGVYYTIDPWVSRSANPVRDGLQIYAYTYLENPALLSWSKNFTGAQAK